MPTKSEQPILVAIHCLVYNHAPYLRECLDGFIKQKTNFRFVAVVHDDVSTDGSAEIIREYADKYPDIIKPIFETENQYSKHNGVIDKIMTDAIAATGAKYTARCEGDDYWTDPLKLQRQVDFLESHPEYGCCCTRYRCYHQQSGTYDDTDRYVDVLKEGMDGLEMNHDNYFAISQIPQLLTAVYRTDIFPPDAYYYKLKNQQDDALFYCMTLYSKIWLMNEVTGVYRKHDNSATWEVEQEGNIAQVKMLHDIFTDCWQYDKSESLREVVAWLTIRLCYARLKYAENISYKEWKQYVTEYRDVAKSLREFVPILTRSMRALALRYLKKK